MFQHCRLVQRHTVPYADSRCQATSQIRVWNSINVSGSTVAEPWITKAKTICALLAHDVPTSARCMHDALCQLSMHSPTQYMAQRCESWCEGMLGSCSGRLHLLLALFECKAGWTSIWLWQRRYSFKPAHGNRLRIIVGGRCCPTHRFVE
jgi:hypothetical protein